jgi:haloacid dehalogenase superfamily, subfamily IA, variant 1 with third motif having Dx(3-4)D or Dx(3-4)E
MKEYVAYMFDADGTIIDTRELIYQSFLHMTKTLGLPDPDRVLVDSLIGLPMPPQLVKLIGPGKPQSAYDEGYAIYSEFHMDKYRDYLGVFPGVKEGLAKLQGLGKKLAVVSSRKGRTLIPFLEAMDIAKFFPVIVSATETEKHKPDPEPALLALKLLEVSAAESVFVGDAIFDMQCAKGANMETAYVEWGGMDYRDWPVQPDFVARTFADLLPEGK